MSNIKSNIEQLKQIKTGTEKIIPEQELIKKLESGRSLVIKLGADPTAPDLHLGHAVVLSKLRQFQDLGHHVIFLIGDFTALIGDPTGRSKTRPPLTPEQILENTKTYLDQLYKILDSTKLQVVYNSEWLNQLPSQDFIKLCAKVTVAKITEREDIANRMEKHQPIGFHELIYPLLQGYDSVKLKADIELGGTDQTFNLLMGRYLQEHYNQEPQVIITLPLLEGLDGVNKMSKSLGNSIGLTEPADQVYGKLMSISDDLMWRYYSILLHEQEQIIANLKKNIDNGTSYAINIKKQMAHKIISRFWSSKEADYGQQQFESLVQRKDLSQAKHVDCSKFKGQEIWILDLLKFVSAVKSGTEAKKLIQEGAITLNNTKITDFKRALIIENESLLKVGKHKFYKLII